MFTIIMMGGKLERKERVVNKEKYANYFKLISVYFFVFKYESKYLNMKK